MAHGPGPGTVKAAAAASGGSGGRHAGEGPAADGWVPQFKAAGPGRWFVLNIRWPSGTCGCVRRASAGKWLVEEDPGAQPYPSRDAAARAGQRLAVAAGGTILPDREDPAPAASPPGQRARIRGRRPA